MWEFVYLTKVGSKIVSDNLLISVGGGLRDAIGPASSPTDLFSFSHVRNATRLEDSRLGALRTASLSKQGLRATVDEQVGAGVESENGSLKSSEIFHRRIGIGLPMSYIYAT